MKRLSVITLLLMCLCLMAHAQTVSGIMPGTIIGAGAAFNQIGTPRTNLWATAIYPVASSAGVYTSTTTDIIPLSKIDTATGRSYYAFTTSVRQGIHKVVVTTGKLTVLIGGDVGAGFSQAAPSGVNVSLAGSFTATAVYLFKPKWGIVVPIRGMYTNGAWNLIPQAGIVFKP